MYTLCLLQFQPGAVEGTVEVTPLAHAAGKGLQGIIKLLIDSGANVNYLCSVREKSSLYNYCHCCDVNGLCNFSVKIKLDCAAFSGFAPTSCLGIQCSSVVECWPTKLSGCGLKSHPRQLQCFFFKALSVLDRIIALPYFLISCNYYTYNLYNTHMYHNYRCACTMYVSLCCLLSLHR